MKKIALFIAFAALSITSCSNDDNNDTNDVVTAEYLQGSWIETEATGSLHIMDFDGNTAVLTFTDDGSFNTYEFTVDGNNLFLSTPSAGYEPSPFKIEWVNENTFKLTSLYPEPAYYDYDYAPVTSTFKRR